MAPKRKSSSKKSQATQPTITEHVLPLPKKPMELIGKQIGVPGAYWEGRMSEEEKKQLYKCTVRDFKLLHKFPLAQVMEAAVSLQEMGVSGTGSTEHGDASGEVFWMPYNPTFLQYYYATFPENLPSPATNPTIDLEPIVIDGSSGAPPKPDVIDAFPRVRLGRAPVMGFMAITADTLVEMGSKAGQYKATFECIIKHEDGSTCGVRTGIYHKKDRAVSTSNLINHMRNCAPGCPAHKAALAIVEKSSKNCVEIDGETHIIQNFSEAFSYAAAPSAARVTSCVHLAHLSYLSPRILCVRHHVDFMYMLARGVLSQKTARNAEFRSYVQGYEPRASFPHSQTIHRLVETVHDLQKAERIGRIARRKVQYRGQTCLGIQLDMWTDTDTHTAFACVSATEVQEPQSGMDDPQLFLTSEIIEFCVFPFSSKTGENIKKWLLGVLSSNGIDHSMVSGVTPDGAADGQCGLSLIPTLAEKVDTCILHQLQRSILFSLGLAGVTSKNPELKQLLRKHSRVVMLSRQSLSVGKAIRMAQINAGVPDHALTSTVATMVTRWGNQYQQLTRNCTLRLAIDPTVEAYKKANKGEKEAIVETDESEGSGGSKVGAAVAANDIGLDAADWEKTQDVEAHLEYLFQIKETIEYRSYCTGAQAMMLLHDVKDNFCHADASLSIKSFPLSLSVAHRVREIEVKQQDDVTEVINIARRVMKEEVQKRNFDARPSNSRLVQCFMSKQMDAKIYLSVAQYQLAETLYKQLLREAQYILEQSTAKPSSSASPPEKKAKTDATTVGNGMLFRGMTNLPKDEQEAAVGAAVRADDEAAFQFDPVAVEIQRWSYLAPEELQQFYTTDGLLNEFKMLWHLRHRFPLHMVVFKLTACHLPHEANVERYFSRAGALSDPNMNPDFLGKLVMVGANQKRYAPSVQSIKEHFFTKYRGKGGEHEDNAE